MTKDACFGFTWFTPKELDFLNARRASFQDLISLAGYSYRSYLWLRICLQLDLNPIPFACCCKNCISFQQKIIFVVDSRSTSAVLQP